MEMDTIRYVRPMQIQYTCNTGKYYMYGGIINMHTVNSVTSFLHPIL